MTLDKATRLFSGVVLAPASLVGVAIAQTGPHIFFLILFVVTVTFALRPQGDGGHGAHADPPPHGAMAIHLDGPPTVNRGSDTVESTAPVPAPDVRGRATVTGYHSHTWHRAGW